MKIVLKNRDYTFLIGYQREVNYRAAFNKMAEEIFGNSFEEWFSAGYWNEKYSPYTI